MGNEAPHGVVIILADPLHGERGVPWPNAAVLVSQLVTQVYQCHVTERRLHWHCTEVSGRLQRTVLKF